MARPASLQADLRVLPETVGEWEWLLGLLPDYDPFADSEGYFFEAELAVKAIRFFHECLNHIEGKVARTPFLLERWQQSYLANLFGWVDGSGYRRYRESLLYVPRKNGKTPLAAGVCNYVLFCDGEIGADIISSASTKDQASLLYRHAKGMVELEPELASRANIYKGTGHRSIVYEAEGSSYKVIAADADSTHGGNPHLVLIDELHAQPNRELVDVLRTSMASANRAQSLLLYITTADFDRPSVCNETYNFAKKVCEGTVSAPYFLPAIYEIDRGDDWTDEAVWAKANPNLGVSVSLEYLRRECKRAQEEPSYENTFRRLHLNQKTEQAERWLQLAVWDACDEDIPDAELAGADCWVALDLSSTQDITALVGVFDVGGRLAVRTRFWVPGASIQLRSRRDRVPYDAWAREGWITETDGDVVDYDQVKAAALAFAGEYRAKLREIGIDPWNATQLSTQLEAEGAPVVHVRQGYATMSPAMKEFERRLVGRLLAHGGNPVLRWMAANVVVKRDDADNIKPSKSKSTERIDGIVALAMAIYRRMLADGDGESVYTQRGIITL